MSTRVEGAVVLIMVTAQATLSAAPTHLILSVREGPAPGHWRYNLSDNTDRRIQYGRLAGISHHTEALRYAADLCRHGYEPGTTERGILEQFAGPAQGRP